MRKLKGLLFIFTLVMTLTLGWNTKAYIISYDRDILGSNSSVGEIRNYYTTINGQRLMVYCLDPGRRFDGGHQNFVIPEGNDGVIDPATATSGTLNYRWEVAITRAYQYMERNGLTSYTDDNQLIGTLVMRLLTMKYNNGGLHGNLADAYNKYNNILFASDPDPRIQRAMTIYYDAVAVADQNFSYEEYVQKGFDNGGLWGVVAKTLNYRETTRPDGLTEITFDLSFNVSISDLNIPGFTVTGNNVTISSKSFTQNGNMVHADIVYDGRNLNGQKASIDVNYAYCNSMDASSNIYILYNPLGQTKQRMIVVLPGSNSCTAASHPNGGRRPYPVIDDGKKDSCECHYDANGVLDGYVIKEDSWTVTSSYTSFTGWTSWGSSYQNAKFVEKDKLNDQDKNNFKCPTCPERKGHTCEKSSESSTGYFCRESAPGKNDGQECTLEEYLTDPSVDPKGCGDQVRSCEKDGNTNYCRDGRECSDEDYYSDCLCGELEDKCTTNPEDPDCDEYYDKCINCSPVVTVPSDCSDLQEYIGDKLYESGYVYTGGISDISKEGTECNRNKANMVKSCVIGKTDANNQSFEDTTIDSTKNNPYCKVWCEESYDFGLPVAKRTQSGSYFTLSTSVKGTRTCYTSAADDSTKPIDEEKFRSDLEKTRREMIDAWNDYNYWIEALKAEVHHTSTSVGAGTCSASYDPCPPAPASCTYSTTGASTSDTFDKVTTDPWSAEQWDYDGSHKAPRTGSYEDGTGSCGCETCTIKDGKDPTTTFQKNRDAALNTLNGKIEEFKNIIAQYNSCSGNMAGNNNGWENDMQFDPEITFSYNENYLNNNENAGKFVQTDVSPDKTTSTYCTTDTGRTYNCLDSSKEYTVNGNNNVPASAQVTEKQFVCDASGCSEKDYTFSTAKWVKKEKTIEASYEPRTDFSTYTQYGTIQKDVTTGKYTLYTPLPDNAFPISLMTKTGVFPFTIKFNNIGQSNSDDNKLGRLIGENYGGDILTAFNKLSSEDKCNINGKKDSSYQSATTQSGYVCHYINNCDECKFTCEDGDCSFDDNCDGECAFTCENCLFDGKSTNYTFRTVSLNNLFPNDRQKGYNWDSNLKADITKKAIQTDGESIYKKAQYSYTLTPSSIQKIREYNKKAGSYTNTYVPSDYETISIDSNNSNEAVYCEQYNGTGANGELYNVKCRSKFLDILDELEGSGRAMASNIVRATRNSDAWELFEGYCTYGYGGKGTNGEDSCVHVGPSWRIRSVD